MKFVNCIGVVFFIHVFVVSVFSFSFQKSLSKNIILNSVQVNLVALPEKTITALHKLKARKVVLLPKKKSKKHSKKNQKSILKKIKERLRKKSQKSILKKIKEAGAKKTANKQSKVLAGNKLSSVLQNQIQNYLEQLKRHVHSFWSIPQWIDQTHLRVEINVYLGKGGGLLRAEYFNKSENEDFNSQAFNALKLASPYPAPPEELVDLLSSSGIVFRFP
ncbi:MAG: TonB C-terminal domain-containing protein [Bdellovibrionaceae bacterium]|nr:TonB C-terminal domain-containing protein [Pseudobdellovibrionaceae bacterium]